MDFPLDLIQCQDYEFHGLRLKCTASFCPEQYSVFDGEEEIGYLRLRHGKFRADYYPEGYETFLRSDQPLDLRVVVYTAHPNGDGCFDDDEREAYLSEATLQIKRTHEEYKNLP